MNKKQLLLTCICLAALSACHPAKRQPDPFTSNQLHCKSAPDRYYEECWHSYEVTYAQYQHERELALGN
jgi:hypothetical protein